MEDLTNAMQKSMLPPTYCAALGQTSATNAARLNVFDVHTLTEVYTWVIADGRLVDHDLLAITMGAVLRQPFSHMLFTDSTGARVSGASSQRRRYQAFYLVIINRAQTRVHANCPLCQGKRPWDGGHFA